MASGQARIASAALLLTAGITACGSSSVTTATPSAPATVTPSPTALFPSGGTSAASPTAASSAPVLVIPQFGLQMSFAGQLGTVTYSIDSSQNGTKQDMGGTPYIVNGVIDVATARYAAMACAAAAPAEASISVFTTAASSLNLAGGPSAWVRAGNHLLGFTPGQSACAQSEAGTEIPLLQQMALSAKAT